MALPRWSRKVKKYWREIVACIIHARYLNSWVKSVVTSCWMRRCSWKRVSWCWNGLTVASKLRWTTVPSSSRPMFVIYHFVFGKRPSDLLFYVRGSDWAFFGSSLACSSCFIPSFDLGKSKIMTLCASPEVRETVCPWETTDTLEKA